MSTKDCPACGKTVCTTGYWRGPLWSHEPNDQICVKNQLQALKGELAEAHTELSRLRRQIVGEKKVRAPRRFDPQTIRDICNCFGRYMEPCQPWTEDGGTCSQECVHRAECYQLTLKRSRENPACIECGHPLDRSHGRPAQNPQSTHVWFINCPECGHLQTIEHPEQVKEKHDHH